ncbi:MAG TPA: hypothetical protein VFN57_11920, partial [Thermomicrobiaceae bacterium]|nr:hypothetical protein [Thermomicrobiaceae bacterium]
DGGHWERFPSNLPVVPIHDVVVKGVELVVATHGRSFWILDDLTPLHQLQDAVAAGGSYLFRPRPTVRMRVYGRAPSEVAPGHVHYTKADTSTVAYLPVHEPDGSLRFEQLEAGANPPQGVVIQYYVERAPRTGVSLTVLDDSGNELRRFTGEDGVPVEPGMNRFVWNMRLPGAPKVVGEDLEPWHRPDGPLVLPGTYRVRLEIDGRAREQAFAIEPDPRVRTSREDLAAQFDFLGQVLGALTTVNRTINRLDALLAQARSWQQRAAEHGAAAVGEAAGELERELLAIRPRLIDVNMRQSQLWPSGLHEKLNALFDSVDSADYAPPRQAREVYAALTGQLDELTRRLDRAAGERAAALNAAIAAAGIPVVGLPA